MIRLALISLLLLAGCDNPLSLLTGGGPNVAANVQAGRTNVQSVGQTNLSDQRIVRPQARTIEQSAGETGVRAEAVQQVVVQQGAPWGVVYVLVALCFLFWELPRSSHMIKAVARALKIMRR